MMIIILSGLIVVQWLTIYRQLYHIARYRRLALALLQQRQRRAVRTHSLRRVASHPYHNAISGWLALQQVGKTMPDGAHRRAVWQGMDSLKAIIRLTLDDYPRTMRATFLQALGSCRGGEQ